ncbi:MAG: 50S ribosomal protein L28 [Candidatus Omnitrophota bacterium]|nr:50S ribosomal protein L28 [Candidatus Omnitrophota bacterium]
MSKICAICGKGPQTGNTIARRGLAKKKGGAGRRITGITKRRFFPNLQKVKAIIQGTPKTIMACTRCIKAGKVIKVK